MTDLNCSGANFAAPNASSVLRSATPSPASRSAWLHDPPARLRSVVLPAYQTALPLA
ncbi:hypothetical protein [Nesterenkonia pannonica]|uniref:hypothetical protein n=1 Tax=Nesterenkonia pannonica TaxID=1548602 RepID=UPI002164C6A2|nr:hypothetical protein [Nesterenkonia pannonica]